jgi:ketosteroid isomerase-like protein
MIRLILAFCLFSGLLQAQESDFIRESYNNIAKSYENLSADDMLRHYGNNSAVFRSNKSNFIQVYYSNDEIFKYFSDEFKLLVKGKKRMACTIKISETRRQDNVIYVSGFQNLEISNESGNINNDTGAFSHVWNFENNEWKLQVDSLIPVSQEEFEKAVSRN